MTPAVAGQVLACSLAVEGVELVVRGGAVELAAKVGPDDAAFAAFEAGRRLLVGLLGWGLPALRSAPIGRPPKSVVAWRSWSFGGSC